MPTKKKTATAAKKEAPAKKTAEKAPLKKGIIKPLKATSK